MKQLNELYAADDLVAIQSTTRYCLDIHSTGDATNPGAIIGIQYTV